MCSCKKGCRTEKIQKKRSWTGLTGCVVLIPDSIQSVNINRSLRKIVWKNLFGKHWNAICPWSFILNTLNMKKRVRLQCHCIKQSSPHNIAVWELSGYFFNWRNVTRSALIFFTLRSTELGRGEGKTKTPKQPLSHSLDQCCVSKESMEEGWQGTGMAFEGNTLI